MRQPVDAERVRRFMERLGASARTPARVYFTGGASAVLEGWREATIDIDLKIEPDDELLRLVPDVKDEMSVNVELASPDLFIPVPVDWRGRSRRVAWIGSVSFHHFDFVSQALAKIERGHARDREDVGQILGRRLATPAELRSQFDAMEPFLYRYPAIDPRAYRAALESALATT